MAHVILVTYSGYIKLPSSLVLDNGLANLAGSLIHDGHEVLIEDFNCLSVLERMTPPQLGKEVDNLQLSLKNIGNSEETSPRLNRLQALMDHHQEKVIKEIFQELSIKIRKHRTKVVGFKCWFGEGISAVKQWCSMLRNDCPDVKIILGGPCCQIVPEYTANYIKNFDFMVTGEGENAITSLLRHIDGDYPIEFVPSILIRKENSLFRTPVNITEDLNKLPQGIYEKAVYPTAGTNEKLNFVIIDESRGCPMSCSFCVHPSYAGNWRKKSVERIIREIESVQKQLGTTYFRLAGSYTPPALLYQLSKMILKNNLYIRFSCFMHINGMKEEYLPTLYDAGLRGIFYGVETADEELLEKAANKFIKRETSEKILFATSKNNIFTTGSFIYPMPFETEHTRVKTMDLVRKVFGNNERASAVFLFPCPMPQTDWWSKRDKFGFEFDDEKFIDKAFRIIPRTMYSPEYQDIMPFSLGGKSHRELIDELALFTRELEKDNVIFNIDDSVAMIAIGCDVAPNKFKNEMSLAFLRGDIEKISSMVESFNNMTMNRAISQRG